MNPIIFLVFKDRLKVQKTVRVASNRS